MAEIVNSKLKTQNSKLFAEAKRYLVGGVNSPVRDFRYADTAPLFIKKGRGAYVWDYDGKKYIDYVLSWGALILGHAYPEVINALGIKIRDGLGFGATNREEIELARIIRQAAPFIEKVRFTNSGTEAVMGAVRAARACTKRDKIVKFENAYHGHADYLLKKGGSGLRTLGIPLSAGVPRDFIKHTIIAPYGDGEFIENVFKKHGHEIGAVLVEPVGGNYGVIEPRQDFLRKLKTLSKRHKAVLIFDEVITGFRFRFGLAAQELGVYPDLICLGKIIGGGLPVGAYAGREDIMNNLAPLGKVYQASTFAGNPVVMQAGISTLSVLRSRRKEYSRIKDLAGYLSFELAQAAKLRGVKIEVHNYGTMFSIRFSEDKKFKKFYRRVLDKGVYFAQSQFEANFLSFAHTEKEIEKTIMVSREALSKI